MFIIHHYHLQKNKSQLHNHNLKVFKKIAWDNIPVIYSSAVPITGTAVLQYFLGYI